MRLKFAMLAVAATVCLHPVTLSAQQSENTLRWAGTASLTTIDPYFNFSREAMLLNGQLVWDTLINKPPEGPYLPLLATEWHWVDDVTLEFKLRDDVVWHDGQPFSVNDAVYTFNYISKPENGVNVQSNVNWIAGAEAVDEHTLRINLKKPFPAALEYISTLHAILPDGFFGDTGQAGANGRLVGTGPYKLVEFIPGDTIRLERFADYFEGGAKGDPKLDAIVFRTIPEASTQIAELLSGGIDWMWRVPKDQAEPLAGTGSLDVVADETMRISYLSMNLRDMEGGNPLQDIRVRQAIAYAIDREQMVKEVVGKGSNVISSPCFKTQFGCVEDAIVIKFDPEKAKALLAEAGYADGLEISLTSFRSREWTEAMSGFLTAVGITVDASVQSYSTTRERVINNDVHLYFGDWGSYSINDVSALLNNFFTMSENDMALDEAVSEALLTASQTADTEVRLKEYDFAVRRIAEQLYWFPLWTHPTVYAFDKNLNFQTTTDEFPRFYQSSWDQE